MPPETTTVACRWLAAVFCLLWRSGRAVFSLLATGRVCGVLLRRTVVRPEASGRLTQQNREALVVHE
ncbi:MAG: hypothetical protein WCB27_11270 [Thermoguttaceae bacterium]